MRYRFLSALVPLTIVFACGGNGSGFGDSGAGDGGNFGDGPSFGGDGTFGDGSGGYATCADAAASKSYVGCDYWPTVTGNNV